MMDRPADPVADELGALMNDYFNFSPGAYDTAKLIGALVRIRRNWRASGPLTIVIVPAPDTV